MREMVKVLLEDGNSQERKQAKAVADLLYGLRAVRALSWRDDQDVAVVLLAYAAYQVWKSQGKMAEGTYQDLVKGRIAMDREVLCEVQQRISEKMWGEMCQVPALQGVEAEAFAGVAFLSLLSDTHGGSRESVHPRGVIRLAQAILVCGATERVGDVCCGGGTFMVEQLLNGGALGDFSGWDLNEALVILAKVRAALLGVDAEIQAQDVFLLAKNRRTVKSFDKVFAGYPFLIRQEMGVNGREFLERKFLATEKEALGKAFSSDWAFNWLVMDLLRAETGARAVCVMSAGSTWNAQDQKMRAFFLKNGWVECVVMLPAKLQTPGVAMALLVLSHGEPGRAVRLVDARACFQQQGRQARRLKEAEILEMLSTDGEKSRMVSMAELEAKGYVLNFEAYTLAPVELSSAVRVLRSACRPRVSFKPVKVRAYADADDSSEETLTVEEILAGALNADEFPEPFEEESPSTVKLGDVVSVKRGAMVATRDLEEVTEKTAMQYLTLADLRDGELVGEPHYLREIPQEAYSRGKVPGKLESGEEALLLAKVGARNADSKAEYKLAFVKAPEGMTYLATGNLYVLRTEADSPVKLLWLKAFLESTAGKAVLNSITTGSVMPTIGASSLEELRIPMPSEAEQTQVVERYQQLQAKVRTLKAQLSEASQALQAFCADLGETRA